MNIVKADHKVNIVSRKVQNNETLSYKVKCKRCCKESTVKTVYTENGYSVPEHSADLKCCKL